MNSAACMKKKQKMGIAVRSGGEYYKSRPLIKFNQPCRQPAILHIFCTSRFMKHRVKLCQPNFFGFGRAKNSVKLMFILISKRIAKILLLATLNQLSVAKK